MYIRRTQTRNTTTGERYFTHRLVRCERLGGKVRQVRLLNLGRHFALPQTPTGGHPSTPRGTGVPQWGHCVFRAAFRRGI